LATLIFKIKLKEDINIEVYFMARQVGKTMRAIERFVMNYDKSIFINPNNESTRSTIETILLNYPHLNPGFLSKKVFSLNANRNKYMDARYGEKILYLMNIYHPQSKMA